MPPLDLQRIAPVNKPPVDWRALPDNDPDDDEESRPAAPDVIEILGFDPDAEWAPSGV